LVATGGWRSVRYSLATRQPRPMSTDARQALQVLFCGEEFGWGFRFSKEALDDEPDLEVSAALTYNAHVQ
jgi:hypothetical protein